jgi:hypothetical protein
LSVVPNEKPKFTVVVPLFSYRLRHPVQSQSTLNTQLRLRTAWRRAPVSSARNPAMLGENAAKPVFWAPSWAVRVALPSPPSAKPEHRNLYFELEPSTRLVEIAAKPVPPLLQFANFTQHPKLAQSAIFRTCIATPFFFLFVPRSPAHSQNTFKCDGESFRVLPLWVCGEGGGKKWGVSGEYSRIFFGGGFTKIRSSSAPPVASPHSLSLGLCVCGVYVFVLFIVRYNTTIVNNSAPHMQFHICNLLSTIQHRPKRISKSRIRIILPNVLDGSGSRATL